MALARLELRAVEGGLRSSSSVTDSGPGRWIAPGRTPWCGPYCLNPRSVPEPLRTK